MNYQHGFLFRINGTESLPPSLCAPAYLPTSFYTLIKTLHIQLKQLIQSLEKGGWFKIENAYGDQIFALSHFSIREFKRHTDQIYAIPKRKSYIPITFLITCLFALWKKIARFEYGLHISSILSTLSTIVM